MIIVELLFRWWVWMAGKIYGAEGLNVPLTVMPTRFIAPILARYGAVIGEHVRFRAPLVIYNGAVDGSPYYQQLMVGNNCFFGRDLFLDLQDKITIDDNVTISHRVLLLTHTDAGESPLRESVMPVSQAPITIRRGAYIGAGAIVLEGVNIGEEAVVAAGALVNKTVPRRAVVGGVPAKIIRIQ